MAEEDRSQKTEDPTPKRLEEAHRKGQVAKSQEVSHWFMLGAAALSIAIFGGTVAGDLRFALRPFLESPHRIPTDLGSLLQLLERLLGTVGVALLLPAIVLVAAAIGGNLIQHRPTLSAERLQPKLNKLSPLKGAKRIFGTHGLVEVAKAVFKIAIIGSLSIWLVWPELEALRVMPRFELIEIVGIVERLALILAAGVLAVMAVIAGLDLLYQKWEWQQNQRMSRQEVKDEHKQSEGDPQIKARIRQVRSERARRRMMTAVPTADVVVTNPTHFAVALKYDQSSMAAPRLVAKGQDLMALKIRELAEVHKIPVVENPPLARALCAAVEVDQEIPAKFYKAVAEVISYVMGLKSRRRTAGSRAAR